MMRTIRHFFFRAFFREADYRAAVEAEATKLLANKLWLYSENPQVLRAFAAGYYGVRVEAVPNPPQQSPAFARGLRAVADELWHPEADAAIPVPAVNFAGVMELALGDAPEGARA